MKKSPRINDLLREKIAKEREQRAKGFYDGLSTLKAHARYTKEGKALIEAAEAYMNRATCS